MEITESLVAKLIAAQYPDWSKLPVTPVERGGWDNRTFRLGDELLVRLPSEESYAAQVDIEQRWLPVLAPELPLPIPQPMAMGEPGEGYPWHWSIYRWIEGVPATAEKISDLTGFGVALAEFLLALQRIDASGGPRPGPRNFWRGGSVTTYEEEARDAIASLRSQIDARSAEAVWEAASTAVWSGPDVWLHGDMAASNVLVRDGELSAVIDFGCTAVGDPACDLTIAWTFLSGPARQVFYDAMGLDDEVWARARGWALWKALITLQQEPTSDREKAVLARKVLNEVLSEG